MPNRDDTLEIIRQELRDLDHPSDSSEDFAQLPLSSFGLTSLEMLQLVLMLEERTGVELRLEEIPDGATMATIADYMISRK